jgi:hypothetical protein
MTSTLFSTARALLENALTAERLLFKAGPPATLTLPAAHPLVGDLVVQDDEGELIVTLGVHHHWHAAPYHHSELPEPDRLAAAAQDALDCIAAVLDGRTVLRISRRDGRIRSTTTYRRDLIDAGPPGSEDEEFIWDGPLRTGTP